MGETNKSLKDTFSLSSKNSANVCSSNSHPTLGCMLMFSLLLSHRVGVFQGYGMNWLDHFKVMDGLQLFPES